MVVVAEKIGKKLSVDSANDLSASAKATET